MHSKSRLRDYFESAVIAVVFALFVRTFVIQAFKIPSGSMEDNLLIGDHILVNKVIYAPPTGMFLDHVLPYDEIHHGEVIVFKYPKEMTRDFIKRTIALPTDSMAINKGKVYRNDDLLDEPYAVYKRPPVLSLSDTRKREHLLKTRIPDHYYFMMGDNRNNSQDSRYWGCVHRDLVKGKALVIYWSFMAREGHAQVSGFGKIKELFYVATHVFHKSRWKRTFKLIR